LIRIFERHRFRVNASRSETNSSDFGTKRSSMGDGK
jgi:hypothetical protein